MTDIPEQGSDSEYRIGPDLDSAPSASRVRWGVVAGLGVVAVVALATLRLPSSLEELEETETSEVRDRVTPTPTTTWVFQPSRLAPWSLPTGSWVGFIGDDGFEALAGRLDPTQRPLGVIDVLPDGSYVSLDNNLVSVWDSDGQWNAGSAGLAALAPRGSRLATADASLDVWDLESRTLVTTVELPAPARHLSWSPNSELIGVSLEESGHVVWDLQSSDLRAAGEAELVAVSPERVALWTGETLELRDLEGRLVRSWTDVTPLEAAAFDPDGQYLALHALGEGDILGLWLLEVFGTYQTRLADAGPFTWTGDGSALVYLDAGLLFSRPLEPGFRSGAVTGVLAPARDVRADDRLRMYDPALVPAGTLSFLEGSRFSRVPLAADSLVGPMPPSPEQDPELLALTSPAGGGIPLSVLRATDHTAIELADQSILVQGTEGGTFALKGHSLTSLEGHSVYTDGSSVKAIVGSAVERILDPHDLSEETVVAVAGVGNSLLVLTETGGRGALYHVPSWSSALTGPVRQGRFPDVAPLVVMTVEPPVQGGRISVAPDNSTIAVAVIDDQGTATTSVLWVGASSPPCWPTFNNVCHLFTAAGLPLDYSPDGHWLLMRDPTGSGVLVSTRGRGVVPLDMSVPGRAAWQYP